ncbi:MAG: hypothetical protein AUK48_14815 [Oscillatoriales cyanobacterium CG2_30_44_21]|nr:MAG: hypothetical protein AUK48_14815 [Oscillatoriales cyanobacterium CG2_30_44_21]
MKCPLCESTEFQDCGKTVAGDRKYRCEICQGFFTSKIFNQTRNDQRAKLHLPDINFLNGIGDRLQKKQSDQSNSQNIFYYPLISKLIVTIQAYLDKRWFIIAIAILYQIGLVILTLYHVMVNHTDIKWEKFVDIFSQNDAHHYVFLSQNGYQSSGKGVEFIVFFPLYPILIRLLTPIFGNPCIAGLVISNIGSVIGHIAFALFLLEAGFEKRKVWQIMGLLFLTPTAIYFNMVYTEGLFLATTALFLCFLGKKYYSLAAIAGFCSALTRSLGFFCIIPYLAHCWQNKLWKYNKYALFKSLFIPMGTVIYLAINAWTFGDPFYYKVFLKNIWYKELVNPTNQYIHNLVSIIKWQEIGWLTVYLDHLLTIILPMVAVLYLTLIIHKKKKILYGLLSWTIGQWVVIASQSFWLSNTRYIGLILPFYIMLEEIIGTFLIPYMVVAIALGCLAIYGIDLFSRGQWLY